MDIPRGQITCLALIFAIIGAGLGGFFLNAKDVEVDATDYNYITDVSGAFHGTDQDIPVDFNPRENVTGYYMGDPKNPDYLSVAIPSLQYKANQNGQGQQMPNNFPYLNTRMSTTYYEIKLDFTRAHGSESPATYNVKITNYTPGDDFGKFREFSYTSTIELSSKFFIERSAVHWPDIYHWWVSQTNIGSVGQIVGCIANLGELLNRTTELQGKHVIFDPISDSVYPAFGGNIQYSTHDSQGIPWGGPGTLGETTWYEFSFDKTSRAVTASTATDSMVIHDTNYSLSDSWLAWGGRVGNLDTVEQDYDTSITFGVTAAMPDESMRYINPNEGVSPMSTYGASKQIITTNLFSDNVSGSVYMNSNPWWDQAEYQARIWVTIGDENNNWDRIPLAVVYIAGQVQDDPDNHIRVWQVDGDGNFDPNHPILDVQTYTGRDVHKYVSWYTQGDDILHGSWHQTEGDDQQGGDWNVQIPRTLYHDGKIQIKDMQVELLFWDSSSDTSWSAETMTLECQVGPILKKEIKWQTNHQAPSINPDDPYQENSTAIQTWFKAETIIEIPIESNVTYWSNGYYNSTIGQIISLKNIDGAYQTTKLNLKLHTEDNDYWVYDDPSKMSIMVSTDSKGGVWIGNVGEDGAEHPMIQIGNAAHVYLEYRVEEGRLHLYQSPIYQFTDFMNYSLLPVIDCTSQIPAYKDLACKSISEISYYVPLTKTQEEGQEKVHLTILPRQLVVRTVVLLDAGGLYIQNGELALKDQFPQYTSSEFVVNAVVHPGDSMTLISGENVLATIGNDGVDKWIYNKKTYDWWEIKVFYVAQGEHGEGIWINGEHLNNNHVYIQAGKYGAIEDKGSLTDGNLTIRMDGVWAFSTQYYEGVNTHKTTVEFDDPGTWHWSKEEFMVVFIGILAQSAAIMYYRFGFNAIDLVVFGGAAAVIWVMF